MAGWHVGHLMPFRAQVDTIGTANSCFYVVASALLGVTTTELLRKTETMINATFGPNGGGKVEDLVALLNCNAVMQGIQGDRELLAFIMAVIPPGRAFALGWQNHDPFLGHFVVAHRSAERLGKDDEMLVRWVDYQHPPEARQLHVGLPVDPRRRLDGNWIVVYKPAEPVQMPVPDVVIPAVGSPCLGTPIPTPIGTPTGTPPPSPLRHGTPVHGVRPVGRPQLGVKKQTKTQRKKQAANANMLKRTLF
eukprot:Hpha_TRINITY_DN3965_c0_g1::TRINITY_DN3965_c0_g1_i1::g.18139::m.18139